MSPAKFYPTLDYQVQTAVYEGPLDLLLELIESADLDITTLSLAKVTDQFLAHLHQLPTQDPDEVSAFLVIASKLVQIKSAALLPRPPVIDLDTEEDTGEALVRQLKEYKKFKEVARLLEERERNGLRTYLRLASPMVQIETKLDPEDFSLAELVQAAQELLNVKNGFVSLDKVVSLPRVTIREKIKAIIEVFRRKQTVSFLSLIERKPRIEIVVTFLAILELIKQNIIEVSQEKSFSDIVMQPMAGKVEEEIAEVEF